MRIAVHDFGGYAFTFELSRELADRGHDVIHLYPPDLPGPKRFVKQFDTPDNLTIYPLDLSDSFRKYSPARRLLAHREYARSLSSAIGASECDVVLSANAPIDIQYKLMNECRRLGVPLVHWIQDIYCLALRAFLTSKIGPLGKIFSHPFTVLERRVSECSAGVICITEDFKSFLSSQSIQPRNLWVIENWTPLGEVKPLPKVNPWSQSVGLDGKAVFLYSGTMGMKHNPALIYELARSLDSRPGVACAVISEGLGRAYLERKPTTAALRLFDFQPYSRLSEVLASADVLVAMIEPEASRFSVPSKILSYMAAGRPVLLASPESNLAARVVREADAGIVIDPRDTHGFIRAAHCLLEDGELCARLSLNARTYAERHFRIQPIADAFESAISEVTAGSRRHSIAMIAKAASLTS